MDVWASGGSSLVLGMPGSSFRHEERDRMFLGHRSQLGSYGEAERFVKYGEAEGLLMLHHYR